MILARHAVLKSVDVVVDKFVHNIAVAHEDSQATASAAGGKTFTFGSYRLGVHSPGTDIDILCVVPKFVSRDDFFKVFEPMLWEVEGTTEVLVGTITYTNC